MTDMSLSRGIVVDGCGGWEDDGVRQLNARQDRRLHGWMTHACRRIVLGISQYAAAASQLTATVCD